jgi:hypothetical protein
MSEPCEVCEYHAELHSGNWLGIGPANEPCLTCEYHAELHSSEGCAVLFLILGTFTAVLVGAGRLVRRR